MSRHLHPKLQHRRNTLRHTLCRVMACGLTLSLVTTHVPLRADTITWIGGTSGNWADYILGSNNKPVYINWSTGLLPTSADSVFNTTGYDTIFIADGGSRYAGTFTNTGVLDVSSGSLDVASDVFNTTTTTAPATIEATGYGTLTLNSQGGQPYQQRHDPHLQRRLHRQQRYHHRQQ